jgi:regulator of extracellular matrix RemA (YlzA/DUF370 family)
MTTRSFQETLVSHDVRPFCRLVKDADNAFNLIDQTYTERWDHFE